MRGILLGSGSPEKREVVVEDFAALAPGLEYDPGTGAIAGRNRHSMPAIGYFRMGAGEDLRISDKDRELAGMHFPGLLHVFLLFQRGAGSVRWADVYVPPGGSVAQAASPVEPQEAPPVEHAAPRHPRYLWVGLTAAVCAVILAAAFWPSGRQPRRHARVVAPV